jgi:hypothetical protein
VTFTKYFTLKITEEMSVDLFYCIFRIYRLLLEGCTNSGRIVSLCVDMCII